MPPYKQGPPGDFREGKGRIGIARYISPRLGEDQRDLAQHNRHLSVAAAGAVKANFTACPREAGVVLVLNVVQPQARSDRSNLPCSRSSTNRR